MLDESFSRMSAKTSWQYPSRRTVVVQAIETADPHGQRISNVLTCEDLCEEVVVPTGDLHFASEAFFQGMVLESRDGEAS